MKAPRLIGWCCTRTTVELFYDNGDIWFRERKWPPGKWLPVIGPSYDEMRPEPRAPATKRRKAKAR